MNYKNISRFAVILIISAVTINISAQEIPVFKEFIKAVDKGTRTTKGVPGHNYWVNHSDYSIDAELSFINDTVWINGKAKITYYNDSPDTLNIIVLRSYPDVMAPAAVRDYYIFPLNVTDPVEYSDLIAGNDTIKSARLMQSRTSTNLIIRLKKPIAPGSKRNLQLGWKYYMHPSINIRQGVYEDNALFVAYWYPQVAVYDDLYGWDMTNYRGIVEFYNDFNNYDIRLTVPPGYLVWAGGKLQNPDEVYTPEIRTKTEKAVNSNNVVNIITKKDLPVDHGNKEKVTWHFKAEDTPDFSFAASKTHLWDASGVEVEDGRRVMVSAVYPTSSKHYHKAAGFARKAIEYLSFECPGVPYPWPSMTVFNSGEGTGGMETPMMVNNGDQRRELYADEVIFHEIAHSYLPFYTGTNERRFAWMDEGWATYQGMKWSEGNNYGSAGMFGRRYGSVAGSASDLPLMVPTYSIFDGMASSFNSYIRSAQAFMTIEDQLGEEKMNRAWKIYTERWHHKHPSPWDLFAIFEEVAGKNLDWLILPWYYEFKHQDLAISSVSINKGAVEITNKGGLPLPVYLELTYSDGTKKQLHRKPGVFKSSSAINIDIDNASSLKSVKLNNPYFFDSDPSDNSWKK